MMFVYNIHELYEYHWICPFCFKPERLTHSTPMIGLNPIKFDIAVELWGQNCNSRQAHFLVQDSAMADFFIIIRKSVSRFIDNFVKPFIRFHGCVDIDETLIGQQRWSYMGHFPQLRWVFGLHDRTTRLPIMYFIKDKSHENLVRYIKKHTFPGSIIFSDSHASYINMMKSQSKLSQYGYYHYWICHITRYVHEKFGFVHTSGIELVWNNMKKSLKGLRYASNPKIIGEYINCHTFRCIFKKEGLYRQVLRCLRQFFDYNYNKILRLCEYDELICPNLWKLDDNIRQLRSNRREEHLQELRKIKLSSRYSHNWQFQDDLYNCYQPKDDDDICPEVKKYLQIERAKGKRLIPYVKNIFIPVTHVLEYREYWDDIDNDKIGKEYSEEYKGLSISSLRNFKGERQYLKQLRLIKEKECIDMVGDYKEREDDPASIKLSFSEKFKSGPMLKNERNEFLIKKSRPFFRLKDQNQITFQFLNFP